MSGYPQRCSCGSGEWSRTVYDAHGIYIAKMCDRCERDRLKAYRPEVLTDRNYECCEDVDND